MAFRFPFSMPAGRLDWLRASVGALAGLLVTGVVTRAWLGPAEGLPLIVAPMGASAVLLFAVPASPLAQPWSMLGGNILSALVGIGCAMLIPDKVWAAAAAVSLAIAAMNLCRCLHPPGGAMALTAVIGGPAVAAAGWSFALVPVGLNCVLMLAMAWAFNNSTRQRYPHRPLPRPANPHGTADPPPQERAGYSVADIDAVLARHDELLDVSREDLDALFREVEARAHRRLHGEIRCADIMSRDLVLARAGEGVGQARDRLLKHRLAAMPVVDADGVVLGLVGHAELLAGAGRQVEEVMEKAPLMAAPETPVDELLPALSGGFHHHALVADGAGRLVGVVSQTDLLAALWRGHVAEQLASAEPSSEGPLSGVAERKQAH